MIKNNIGLILSVILLTIVIVLLINPSILVYAFYPDYTENPFDKMRESEHEIILRGELCDVVKYNDPYDGRQSEVIVDIGYSSYPWVNWEYDDLKPYEGQDVIIHCYTNNHYPYYSLSPVSSDRSMGYIENL